MSDRGMMKWLPYKSLNEQGDFLNEMLERKSRVEKPLLSSEMAEEVNARLLAYHGGHFELTYWAKGHIYRTEGESLSISKEAGKLIFPDGERIPIKNVVAFEAGEADLFDDGDEALPAD